MRRITMFLVVVGLLVCCLAYADVPRLINFQGRLTDATGKFVPDGNYSLTFRIYVDSTGGSSKWAEAQLVSSTKGLFNVVLGTVTPIPDSIFKYVDTWLGIQVASDPEMTPRQRLSSLGYSYRGAKADTASYSMNSDKLDGLHAVDFTSPVSDYGRSGVATDLYEGSSTLTDKYVNETGPEIVTSTSGTAFEGYVYGNSASDMNGILGTADNSGSGTTKAGAFTTYSSGTGIHYGVVGGAYGNSSYPSYGVFGSAINYLSGSVYGGYFTTDDTGSGYHYGVRANGYGSSSNSTYGTYSYADNSSSGNAYGGYFSTSSNGTGIHLGVSGLANGASANSVRGVEGAAYGSSTGYTYGIFGWGENSSSGNSYGGYFTSSAPGTGNHYGVYGRGYGNSSSSIYGTYGYSSNTGPGNSYGSYGLAYSNSSGEAYGGYYYTDVSGSGNHYGVYAEGLGSSSNYAYGVKAHASNTSTGPALGGYFETDSLGTGAWHYGVYATGKSTSSPYTAGVLGYGEGSSSIYPVYGFYGLGYNRSSGNAYGGYFTTGEFLPVGTGKRYGVVAEGLGQSDSTTYGVYGYGYNSSTGDVYGGYFTADSSGTASHYGVRAESYGTSSYSAYGAYITAQNSSNGPAIGGYFSASQSGTGSHIAVSANGYGNSSSYVDGVDGWAQNFGSGSAYAGYFYAASSGTGTHYGVYAYEAAGGSGAAVYASGDMVASGTKPAVLKTSKGHRLLYAQESPEVWFEDFGEGQLVTGRDHIELDPLFLETVVINSLHPMKVFVQLEGDCNGVYVSKGATGFDVTELKGGNSSVSFSYRVVAKRKGYENERLRETDAGKDDPNLYPELRAGIEKRYQAQSEQENQNRKSLRPGMELRETGVSPVKVAGQEQREEMREKHIQVEKEMEAERLKIENERQEEKLRMEEERIKIEQQKQEMIKEK